MNEGRRRSDAETVAREAASTVFSGLDGDESNSSLTPVLPKQNFLSRLFQYAVDIRKRYAFLRDDYNRQAQELQEVRGRIKELTNRAYIDKLTGLPNRQAFELALEHAKLDGHHLAIGIIDLDKFKAINDTHGHGVGDEALCAIAAFLQGHIRSPETIHHIINPVDIDLGNIDRKPCDVLCRLGGDEFIIIFRDTNAETMRPRMESIMQGLANQVPFSDGCQTLYIGGSMGIVDCPSEMAVQDAVKLADAEMYRIKNAAKLAVAEKAKIDADAWYQAEMAQLQQPTLG